MTFEDSEFGEVILRKNAWSTRPKFSIDTSGKLVISAPRYTSVFLAKRWLNASRKDIREKLPVKDPSTQRARDAQKKILSKKAREYLPYRLEFWAKKYPDYVKKIVEQGHEIGTHSCSRKIISRQYALG